MKKIRLTKLNINSSSDVYANRDISSLLEQSRNLTTTKLISPDHAISPLRKNINPSSGASSCSNSSKINLYSRKYNNFNVSNNKLHAMSHLYTQEEKDRILNLKSLNNEKRNEATTPASKNFEQKKLKENFNSIVKESRNIDQNDSGIQKFPSIVYSKSRKNRNLRNVSSWQRDDLSKFTTGISYKISNLRVYSPTNMNSNNNNPINNSNNSHYSTQSSCNNSPKLITDPDQIDQNKFTVTSTDKISKFAHHNNSNTNNISISNNPNPSNQSSNKEAINVTSLISNPNIPLALSNLSVNFPFYESTKSSSKSIGVIKAYSANTYQGIVRNYNEDRVSIILNISKPQNFKGNWPKCSFFGIYDGHGGNFCADFLRDNLHCYVIKDPNFPENPKEALLRGFEQAEKEFLFIQALTKKFEIIDKSGSCAIVALIIEDICYIANVGDSRAVLSLNGGTITNVITNDHKPNEDGENKRIIQNGGKVYQTQTPTKLLNMANLVSNNSNKFLIGPYRVFPGRLSVSRTFGDVEAKIPQLGGIPGVVIATPEITSFKITDETDFLVLGCDGIFDQLSNNDCVECVWMTMKEETRTTCVHSQCAIATDMIMKSSLVRRTLDNITVVLLSFKNFETVFNQMQKISTKSSFCLNSESKEHFHTDSETPYSNQVETILNDIPNNTISPTSTIFSSNGNNLLKLSEPDHVIPKVKSFSPKIQESNNTFKNNKINFNTTAISKLIKEKFTKVGNLEANKKIVPKKIIKNEPDPVFIKKTNITLKLIENKNLTNLFRKIQG